MNLNKRLLLICIAVPLMIGTLAAALTKNSMEVFSFVEKPPFSPPGGLFPVVWTILYILMGISSYLILTSDVEFKEIVEAMRLYIYQLLVNFLWPTFFFNFRWYLFAFFWLVLLWILVFLMMRKFYTMRKSATLLNIPYILWLTFAGYLNFGIWWLNR